MKRLLVKMIISQQYAKACFVGNKFEQNGLNMFFCRFLQ